VFEALLEKYADEGIEYIKVLKVNLVYQLGTPTEIIRWEITIIASPISIRTNAI
jgi:hypothetical protein